VILLLLLFMLFSWLTAEAEIPPLDVQMPQVFAAGGEVKLFDGSLFQWSSVQVLDSQRNVVYLLQTDHEGKYIFPALTNESYIVRGSQPDYAYAPPEIPVINVQADLTGLNFYAGPASWFPPNCQLPADLSTNVLNPPCYVDITPTATDDAGQSVTSDPIRIYFHPAPTVSPSPTPSPTPTPEPTATPTPEPTATPTPTPTPTPSPTPTATPTPTPIPTPTPCRKPLPNGRCKK
jgi:hypothetical protein